MQHAIFHLDDVLIKREQACHASAPFKTAELQKGRLGSFNASGGIRGHTDLQEPAEGT